MAYSANTKQVSSLLTLLVVVVVLCGTVSCADLGFQCVFGPMITSTTPEGETVEFCPTQMHPPVMTKGDYLVADKNGTCYECMCAPDTGLACC
ncbi:unnamed protein product, partial [Candidula unifasciata]